MRERLKTMAWGMAGVAVALLLWHLYADHHDLHVLLGRAIAAESAKAK